MTDTIDIARKMRGTDGTGRVLVLDVGRSSTQYHIYLRERASRHAYYLRPPEGMDAYDLKRILDEAGGETELGFRYWVYPEVETDLKPILSADPYAGKHFDRDDVRRFLQIEGERPLAREAIARLLEGLKRSFDPDEFPRINEFELQSFKPAAPGGQAEAVLIRKDRDRNELRKAEPGFNVALAEHGFAKEIDVHRPVLAETEPVLMLNSNASTTASGHQFLTDLVAYFGSATYTQESGRAFEAVLEADPKEVPSPGYIPFKIKAPSLRPNLDSGQLLGRAAAAIKDQLPSMKLLRKREATLSGPQVIIRFPGRLGFGKGPSEGEIKELKSIYRATKGDPSLGSDWHGFYQVDNKTGDLRVALSLDADPPKDWTAFRE